MPHFVIQGKIRIYLQDNTFCVIFYLVRLTMNNARKGEVAQNDARKYRYGLSYD